MSNEFKMVNSALDMVQAAMERPTTSFDMAVREGRVIVRHPGTPNSREISCARCSNLIQARRGHAITYYARADPRPQNRWLCAGCTSEVQKEEAV